MQADSRKTGIQAFIWTEGDNERLVQRLSHQQRSSMAEWTVCLAKSTAQENKATFSSQSGVSDRDKEEEWERDMVGEEDYSLIKNELWISKKIIWLQNKSIFIGMLVHRLHR